MCLGVCCMPSVVLHGAMKRMYLTFMVADALDAAVPPAVCGIRANSFLFPKWGRFLVFLVV